MRRVITLVMLLWLAQDVRATVLLPAEFREVVAGSQIIVYGRVAEVRPEWSGDRTRIDTIVTLEAGSYLKGGPGDAVADIIVLVTASPTPVLDAGWVKPGAHVIGVGACRPNQREIDPQLTARARLFIGVDSMPMHLAAAMGTPTVALFGPSREAEWGPWNVEQRVVTTTHSCRPCGLDGCGGGKVSECLTFLPVDAVHAAARELLARAA